MGKLTVISVIAAASAFAACGARQTPTTQLAAADCSDLGAGLAADLYRPEKIEKVEPIYREQFIARAIQHRYVAGARLYVPAQEGVHAAYMERALSCHAGSADARHPNDPLLAKGVADIDVSSAGSTMRISVLGSDRASGEAIWKRAQALHEQGDVSVQQLSSAEPARTSF